MTAYPIVRLQVQTAPLKEGKAPLRRYVPAPIESVPRLEVSPQGVVGLARGPRLLDVHHVDHPATRDPRGRGGVTIMGTGDYRVLRDRYGDHLVEGIAGETILVEAPSGLADLDLPAEISIRTAGGTLVLTQLRAAAPCVEFSRFCLDQDPSALVAEDVRQALLDLDNGARGYRAVAAGEGVIVLGDLLDLP